MTPSLGHRWKRPAALALALIFGALLLPQTAATQSRPLVVIQGAEPESLDASMQTGMLNLNVSLHAMEPLVTFDEKMRLVPVLATAWRWLDPSTMELKLRPGVKFSDGTPFRASDVKFTFDRIIDRRSTSEFRRYINERVIREARVVDDTTVQLRLTGPRPVLVRNLVQLGMASEAAVARLGAQRYHRAPVGTGPYKIKEWTAGVRVVLEANETYWGGAPKIREIHWRWIKEDSTRVAELLAGRADLITALPPDSVKAVEQGRDTRVESTPSLRSVFIAMNTKKAPLNDVRVRRAFNYAVNADAMITRLLSGWADRIPSVFGPLVFGYNPRLKPFQYDPERAKTLLAEAGHGRGLSVSFFAYKGRLLKDKEISESIAAYLMRVGVKVSLQFVEFLTVMGFVRKYSDEVDLLLFSNANNNADASYNLELNFWSKGRGTYWSNPQVDDLIETAGHEADEGKRERMYQEALRLLTEVHVPVIPLFQQRDLYGVNKRLQGFKVSPDESIKLGQATVR
ncbi:MAG: hypothetical protein HY660_05990 [Armatimonadetes bacterium]|nr:hypothetical protein [Armatimonadota bacterium]